MIGKPKNTETDFWDRVDIRSEDDCWEWGAYRNKDGYGRFTYRGSKTLSHRLAYALTRGVPVDRLDEIRHTCDNPGCCNPKHLINGTHAENIQDMVMKGRCVRARGEQHGKVKLTEKDVLEIRGRYSNGEKQKTIASEYGVSPGNISSIIRERNWSWLHG